MGGDWREREPNSSDSVVVVLLGEYGTVIVGGSRTGTGGTGVVQRSIGGGSFTTRVAPELKAAAQRENSSCIEGIQRKLGTARSSALTFALRNSKIIDSFAPGTARSSALLRLGTARSSGIAMECLRRVFKYFVPADVKPKNKDADDLTGPLLNEDGKCLYNCCAPIHGNYEIETGVSTSSDSDDFDEIVSSDEIEEWSETLVDKRKGKQLVEDDRVQEIIGTIYPGGPGRPKLVHFKVSDNYFKVSDNAGAQALRREASAKVHPQLLNATADEAHVAVAVDSSSHDVKQGVDSDRYKITPPLQELMQHGNIPPEGDEIQPIEGQSSHQVVIDMT